MLIELYVGTLTRYYAEQWHNGHTRAGNPSPFTGTPNPNTVNDPVELQGIIAGWIADASARLKEHLPEPLAWQEGMGPEYRVAELGFPGYGGAIMLAAYTATGYTPRPTAFQPNWNKDPAIEILNADERKKPLWEIINCNIWMPGRFDFGIGMKDPAGMPIRAGSLDTLWAALQHLNEVNWNAAPSEIETWAGEKLDSSVDFDTQARAGYAAFHGMCRFARERRLPMKLHF